MGGKVTCQQMQEKEKKELGFPIKIYLTPKSILILMSMLFSDPYSMLSTAQPHMDATQEFKITKSETKHIFLAQDQYYSDIIYFYEWCHYPSNCPNQK